MSALVSVTICTADRQIFRFPDLDSAASFRRAHTRVGGAALAAPRRADVRERGENRLLVLKHLSTVDQATSVQIAAAMQRTDHTINKLITKLLDGEQIKVVHRGARGQRHYSITDKGRAEVARHA